MMADSQHDYLASEGQQLQRTLSTSSLDSVLPPPLKHKRRVLILLSVLGVTTVLMLVVSCLYSDIAGNVEYWYDHPESWQFCVVYADYTLQVWKQSKTDSTASQLSYLGLQNLFFTWLAVASTFRSLFHYEWIPSTLAFLFFILFGQLMYFQSTNLITVVPKLPSTLLSVSQWVRLDMYDHLGTLCTDSYYSFAGFATGNIFPREIKNCTDSFILLNQKVQDAAGDQILEIELITNSSIPDEDNHCGSAVDFHILFLVLCYTLVAITFGLMVVLVLADREIRRSRPQRHFFKETGQDLKGDKICIWNSFWATVGYVMTSAANLDSSFVSLKNVRDYHLISSDTDITKEVNLGAVSLQIDFDYYMNSWLPFRSNQLNLQTVLLIVTVMSVIRGHFKQSISAFRLGAVGSLLSVIIMWPTVVGNMETMKLEDLWWWSDYDKCVDFHSGIPYENCNRASSEKFCNDTRWAMAGSLISFVAMHFNIYTCAYVYQMNQNRPSLALADEPGLGDPFTFDYGDAEYNAEHNGSSSNTGQQMPRTNSGAEKPSKPANTPTPM